MIWFAGTSPCPTSRPGYYEIATVDHNYCYYISHSDLRTWFAARQACNALSGDLAKIYNEEIRVVLKELYLTENKYWIGLVGRVWYWENGKTIREHILTAQCIVKDMGVDPQKK